MYAELSPEKLSIYFGCVNIAYILLRQRVGKSIFSSAIGSALLVHYSVELASGQFWANDFERKQIRLTVKTGLKYFILSYLFILFFSKTNIPRIQIYLYWSFSHVKRRYLFGRLLAYQEVWKLRPKKIFNGWQSENSVGDDSKNWNVCLISICRR